MPYSIVLPNLKCIVTMSNTEYTCPKCKHIHDGLENGVYDKLPTLKRDYVSKKCDNCKEQLLIFGSYNGDLVAELKNDDTKPLKICIS